MGLEPEERETNGQIAARDLVVSDAEGVGTGLLIMIWQSCVGLAPS